MVNTWFPTADSWTNIFRIYSTFGLTLEFVSALWTQFVWVMFKAHHIFLHNLHDAHPHWKYICRASCASLRTSLSLHWATCPNPFIFHLSQNMSFASGQYPVIYPVFNSASRIQIPDSVCSINWLMSQALSCSVGLETSEINSTTISWNKVHTGHLCPSFISSAHSKGQGVLFRNLMG